MFLSIKIGSAPPTALTVDYIVTCQAHPVLVKKANQVCGSFLFKKLCLGSYPWPRVLSLPEWFVGDPASLARDSIFFLFFLLHISHTNLISNDSSPLFGDSVSDGDCSDSTGLSNSNHHPLASPS